jgi:hypothetical protein
MNHVVLTLKLIDCNDNKLLQHALKLPMDGPRRFKPLAIDRAAGGIFNARSLRFLSLNIIIS